jgi:hypothetical protein
LGRGRPVESRGQPLQPHRRPLLCQRSHVPQGVRVSDSCHFTRSSTSVLPSPSTRLSKLFRRSSPPPLPSTCRAPAMALDSGRFGHGRPFAIYRHQPVRQTIADTIRAGPGRSRYRLRSGGIELCKPLSRLHSCPNSSVRVRPRGLPASDRFSTGNVGGQLSGWGRVPVLVVRRWPAAMRLTADFRTSMTAM